jgi:type II secretion system protein L
MKTPSLSSFRWLDVAAAWRPRESDRLELWLPRDWPGTDTELRWRRTELDGAARQGSQRGLEGLASAGDLVVWTPAAETLLLRARLPTRSPSKIAQALPFALEDQLIDAPEKLHFAFTQEADGALAVAVTRHERMEGWLAAFAAAGLSPARLAPVTLSLPLAERAWTLAFRDGEMVLRCGPHAGFGGPRESQPPGWLHTALAEARAEAKAPERIVLLDAPEDLDSAAWGTALGLPLEPLASSRTAVPVAPLNLLQQRYVQRGGHGAKLQRAYLPAAALLAAWLAVTPSSIRSTGRAPRTARRRRRCGPSS